MSDLKVWGWSLKNVGSLRICFDIKEWKLLLSFLFPKHDIEFRNVWKVKVY